MAVRKRDDSLRVEAFQLRVWSVGNKFGAIP
jgi:hypothetical protein